MADEDRDGPSLELPSLGFGRKRGKKVRAAEAEHEPVEAGQEPEPEPGPGTTPTTILDADEPTRATEPEPAPDAAPPLFVDEVAAPPAVAEPAPGGPEEAEKPRREFALPSIGGMPSAIVTGVLVGVITVGLTWAGLRLCEVVKGTSSCGTPGFLLLIAILVAMVLLGSLLLRAWGVPDPGSTSFLSVGLLAVLALLFLVDELFNWWMIIVIPVLSALTFVLSHWVTTAFVEPAEH